MFLRLLVLFITIPLIELYLLFRLAAWTSPLATVALVISTGIIGSFLAKREGAAAWQRFRESLGSGRVPSTEIQDGLMIVFAAALLLTPGMLTDAFGLLLLFKPTRGFIRRSLLGPMLSGASIRFVQMSGSGNGSDFSGQPMERPSRNDPNTIDATAVRTKGQRE